MKELGSAKTYERTSTPQKSIVDNHCYHITTKFAVGIKENQEKLHTLYWLLKHVLLQILFHARLLNCPNC